MQTSTLVILACLVAMVAAAQEYEVYPAVDSLQAAHNTPVQDRSPRTKRGILWLKKKLLLGALGLKAKVGAVGAGVVGALALKGKAHDPKHHAPHVAIKSHDPKHHAPQETIKSLAHHHHHQPHHFNGPAHSHVEVHGWSG